MSSGGEVECVGLDGRPLPFRVMSRAAQRASALRMGLGPAPEKRNRRKRLVCSYEVCVSCLFFPPPDCTTISSRELLGDILASKEAWWWCGASAAFGAGMGCSCCGMDLVLLLVKRPVPSGTGEAVTGGDRA
jgi:hypothetical protein